MSTSAGTGGRATVPVRVLAEAVSHSVTVELKNGDQFRGNLVSVEDNMNCMLEGVTKTRKDSLTLSRKID